MTDERKDFETAYDEEPDIAAQVAIITGLVIVARRRITSIMGAVDINTLTNAEQRKINRDVNEVLTKLDADLQREVTRAVNVLYEDGRARAMTSLGLFEDVGKARRYLRSDKAVFSRAHRAIRAAEIETTMDDLLQMTQNTRRRVKSEIRRIAAEVYRSDESVRSLKRQMSRELKDAGVFAIRDSAGRRWKIDHYTEVVATTKLAETHRLATEQEAREQGAGYVVISRHGDSCSKCRPWQGRLLRLNDSVPGNYPTVAEAISKGLFHPTCKHVMTPARDPDFVPDWVIK